MTPDTNTDAQTNALKGQALEQLMDRLEADLEETRSSEACDLLGRLRAQPLQADSIDAVARLHTLWMRAGDAPAARAVLDEDGSRLLASASRQAYADIRMQLALYRLQIAHYLDEDDTLTSTLAQMREIVETEPTLVAERYHRLRVLDSIERDRPSHALAAIELRHALNLAIPERASVRAWDEAERQVQRAWAYRRLKENAAVHEAADAAVAALTNASADQDIDSSDWLRVGDALIDIAPHLLASIERAVTELTAEWSLPQRREMQVRVARLAARAAYAQGNLADALAACELARISLESNGSDDFIEYELPWLIEAKRFDEAGERAFFHIYEHESEMLDIVGRIVHEQLANPADTSVWWALCAMRSCNTLVTLQRLVAIGREGGQDLLARSAVHAEVFAALATHTEEQALDLVSDAAHALAERRAPGHPWAARIAAVHDERVNRVDAATQAERLFALVQQGGFGDKRTAYSLLLARTRSMGLAAALKQPLPRLTTGFWCYVFACTLDEFVEQHKGSVSPDELEDVDAWFEEIRTTVYELGREHMERFFETGKGHSYDGCAHLYSMLCNNLAIQYETLGRYPEAIELHERGIAASPFAEHYSGLVRAAIASKEDAGIVSAAEQLWHFSAEHGFSRHYPNGYFIDVIDSLRNLDRSNEIPIWLERLVKWQQQEQEVEEGNLPADALAARLAFTSYLAMEGHGDAAPIWEQLRAQAEKSTEYLVTLRAAATLHHLNRRDEAKVYYERALAINARLPEGKRNKTRIIEECLAEYREQAQAAAGAVQGAARKPWWKIW